MGFTNSLPAELAGALKASSGDSSGKCGAVGAAGPVIAVLFGAGDGFHISEAARGALTATVRREVRKLARMLHVPTVGSEDASPRRPRAGSTASLSFFAKKDDTPPPDVFELALKWCASPAVPSYEVGLHLALGDADKKSILQASSYAWILRLICRRRNVDLVKIAPTLASVAKALCDSLEPSAQLHHLLTAAPRVQRRVSFSEESSSQDASALQPAVRPRSHTVNFGARRDASGQYSS